MRHIIFITLYTLLILLFNFLIVTGNALQYRLTLTSPSSSKYGINSDNNDNSKIYLTTEDLKTSVRNVLFGNDETAVSCAVGALLNILGDELGPESDSNETRKAFKKMLADSIAMGAVWQACFETMDVQDQC